MFFCQIKCDFFTFYLTFFVKFIIFKIKAHMMHPDKVNHMRLNLTEQMFKFEIFYLSVKILLTLHLFCKNIRLAMKVN